MKYVTPYQNFNGKKMTRIVFLGDIMQHERQIDYYMKNDYDMKETFQDIIPIINRADFVVGNIETTFSGPPYTNRLENGHIIFSAPDDFLRELDTYLKIDLMNLAQNHILDHGYEGLNRTVNQIADKNILWNGVKNSDYISVQIKKIPFRFYNYTMVLNRNPKYFDDPNYDHVGFPYSHLKNKIPDVCVYPGIENIEVNPNYINIMCIHSGEEFSPATEEQKVIADQLIEKGFTAVIGSHSHSPIPAIYNKNNQTLKIYSLGNFISDQYDWRSPYDINERGIILVLHIDEFGKIQKYEEHNIDIDVQSSGKTKIKLI